MNEDMDRLQVLLLTKKRPKSFRFVIPVMSIALLLALITVLWVGQASAATAEEEKIAAQKICQQRMGPLGVALWTNDGRLVCKKISAKS